MQEFILKYLNTQLAVWEKTVRQMKQVGEDTSRLEYEIEKLIKLIDWYKNEHRPNS